MSMTAPTIFFETKSTETVYGVVFGDKGQCGTDSTHWSLEEARARKRELLERGNEKRPITIVLITEMTIVTGEKVDEE